jgi:hypothetical protein
MNSKTNPLLHAGFRLLRRPLIGLLHGGFRGLEADLGMCTIATGNAILRNPALPVSPCR